MMPGAYVFSVTEKDPNYEGTWYDFAHRPMEVVVWAYREQTGISGSAIRSTLEGSDPSLIFEFQTGKNA